MKITRIKQTRKHLITLLLPESCAGEYTLFRWMTGNSQFSNRETKYSMWRKANFVKASGKHSLGRSENTAPAGIRTKRVY